MENSNSIDSPENTEKSEPDANEIMVLDEKMPSPVQIQADETIVLTEIISMPEYIRRHCEKDLIRKCIGQIYARSLCVTYEGKMFHDVPAPMDSGEEMILTDGL